MKKVDLAFQKKQSVVQLEERGTERFYSIDDTAYPYEETVVLDIGFQQEDGVFSFVRKSNVHSSQKRPVGLANLVLQHSSMIRKCIDSEQKQITLVLSPEPSFDKFAAVWLIRSYIEQGTFPDVSELIAEYAAETAVGKKTLDPDQHITPYTLAYAVTYFISFEQGSSDEAESSLTDRYFQRGFELVEFVAARLASLPEVERDLDSPTLFRAGDPFEEEKKLLKDDKGRYVSDIQSSRTTVKKVMLPTFTGDLKEVSGVFWHEPPTCYLHKLWARSDVDQYSGEPFVFTSIPSAVNGQDHYQYIISVKPDEHVHLQGLDQLLNYYENRLRPNGTNGGTSPTWVPWQNGDYTMIQTGSSETALSSQKIKEVCETFTIPVIMEANADCILPFEFNELDYEDLRKSLSSSYFDFDLSDAEIISYFRPYIQGYFFNTGMDITTANRSFCSFLQSKKRDGEWLILFKYGIGFVVTKGAVKADQEAYMTVESFIQKKKEMEQTGWIELFEEACNAVRKGLRDPDTLYIDQPLFYSWAVLDQATFHKEAAKELVYKFTLNVSWTDPFSAKAKEIRRTLQELYHDQYEQVMYGFSKKGATLIFIDSSDERYEEDNRRSELLKEHVLTQFNGVEFYIFILALHQRYCLMHFSKRLSSIGNKKNYKEVSELRSVVLEFIVQGWFSQITNHDEGMKKYEKWTRIFSNEVLHHEVLEQVETLDQYYRSRFSNKIETVSALFMPFVFLNVIVGIGFFQLSELVEFQDERLLWGLIGSILLTSFLAARLFIKEQPEWLFKWLKYRR